jgi:hypothetical protein
MPSLHPTFTRVCAAAAAGCVLALASADSASATATARAHHPTIDKAGIAETIVDLARIELARDVREAPMGSNNSPDIARYRSALTPRPRGGPWCAYFTSYLAATAGSPLGVDGAGIASVGGTYLWARHTGRLTAVARPGELILYRGLGHIGVVESVVGAHLTTIDGNYSNRVIRRQVLRSDAQGFVRVYPDGFAEGEALGSSLGTTFARGG